MTDRSYDSSGLQHESDLSALLKPFHSLTQTSLEKLELDKSKEASAGNAVEVERYWKGVQDYNRQLVFELDPELYDPANHSDSSAEYASHIERADDALGSLDLTDLCSLKLYKSMPAGSSPFSVWASASPANWPDKSYSLPLLIGIHQCVERDSGEQAIEGATSADDANKLAERSEPQDITNAIEVADCANGEMKPDITAAITKARAGVA